MHIVIIGNGISGVTAARFIRKLSDYRITLISGETDYFFARTALMYVYMGHIRISDTEPYARDFWKKSRIDLLRAWVEKVDVVNKMLITSDGRKIGYDRLIIASGSTPRWPGIPGENLEGVQGLYSVRDLERMERASAGLQRAVIVGGGLIGVEMAEMFSSRGIPVTFLVRETSFLNNILPAEESDMVNRHLRSHKIDLRLETQLSGIVSDAHGRVSAAQTSAGDNISCGFVGMTIGVRPNISFLEGSGISCSQGVLVNAYLETSAEDVWAIGDCAELEVPMPGRQSIEAMWYTGRMMGETVAYTVCGRPTVYQPGIWFNSAKFFDIEYQVYGTVPAGPAEAFACLYGENAVGRKSIRLVFDRNTRSLVGISLMGVRFRQEKSEEWIRAGTSVEKVVEELWKADFDPEFCRGKIRFSEADMG